MHERALCGLRINHITAVRKTVLASELARCFFLNLLALKLVAMPQQDSGCMMELSFLVAHQCALTTKQIDIVVGDLDIGRPTNLQPRHDF